MPRHSDEGAIYCRAPLRRSGDQSGVDLRERACRTTASELGVRVAARHVFIDQHALAWSRGGTAWDAMTNAVRRGTLTHLILYGTGELLQFRPQDLAQLVEVAERHQLLLADPIQSEDLNSPQTRRALLERTRLLVQQRGVRSTDARSAQHEAARQRRPHGGGRRAYGYEQGTWAVIAAEAAIVQQIFALFLADSSLRAIAWLLNARGVPTAYGSQWSSSRVARIIDAPRYAGMRVVRGEILRHPDGTYVDAAWTPLVGIQVWEAAQARRRAQAEQAALQHARDRHYPLTSQVVCTRCERSMVGSMVVGYPTYACTGNSLPPSRRCSRHISAVRLEELVDAWIVDQLAKVPHTPPDSNRVAVPRHEDAAVETAAAVAIRAADAFGDLPTGRQASSAWRRLPLHRKEEVRRFLVAQVRVDAAVGPRSVFDPTRVTIRPHHH